MLARRPSIAHSKQTKHQQQQKTIYAAKFSHTSPSRLPCLKGHFYIRIPFFTFTLLCTTSCMCAARLSIQAHTPMLPPPRTDQTCWSPSAAARTTLPNLCEKQKSTFANVSARLIVTILAAAAAACGVRCRPSMSSGRGTELHGKIDTDPG